MNQHKTIALALSLILLLGFVAAPYLGIGAHPPLQHAIAEGGSAGGENPMDEGLNGPSLPLGTGTAQAQSELDPPSSVTADPDGSGEPPEVPEGTPPPESGGAPPDPVTPDGEGGETENGANENEGDENKQEENKQNIDGTEPLILLPGEAALGAFPPPSAEQGGLLTLALPVAYAYEGRTFLSNVDTHGAEMPYDSAYDPLAYDQAIAEVLFRFTANPSWSQDANLPLALSTHMSRCELIQDGVNQGYLVFSDIPVLEDAEPGEYTLYLEAEWQAIGGGEPASKTFPVAFTVEPGTGELDEEARIACICCVHCVLCYTEEGELAVEDCACVDEEGTYQGCSCDCPFLKTETEGEEAKGEAGELTAEPFSGAEEGSPAAAEPSSEDEEPGDSDGEAEEEWIDCGCDCHQSVSREARFLGGIIVYTYDQLKEAIEKGTETIIYLGYDEENKGTIQNSKNVGIAVSRSITIVGTDPIEKKRMRFIDSATISGTSSFYANAADVTVSFLSMDYTGNNSYGMLYDGNSTRSTTLNLTDVNYTGRRPICMAGSNKKAQVQDCTIVLNGGSSEGFAQISDITLAGDVKINRSGNSGAVFSMTGTNPSITVKAGADVTISMGGTVFAGAGTATLNVMGSLSYSSNANPTSITSPQLGSIIVSGTLIFTGTSNQSYHITCNTLAVNPGATMVVIGSAACVGVRSSISVNNPACFLLMNDTASGKLAGEAQYSLTGNAINLVMANGSRNVWNNNDLSTFTISGRLNHGSDHNPTSSLLGNRGASRYGPIINNSTFSVHRDNPRALIIAPFPDMRIDPVFAGATKVTGRAPGSVTVEEVKVVKNDPSDMVIQLASGLGGNFCTPESWKPISDGTRVYALGSIPVYPGVSIEAHIYYELREELTLYTVPKTLKFKTSSIQGGDQIIDREVTDWTIEVLDTRTSGSPWQLTASVTEPLHTEDGLHTLPGGLLFIEEDGDTFRYLMPDNPVLIDSRPANQDPMLTSIQWPQEKGLHVYLPASEGIAGEAYSTVITWTLTDGL